MRTTEQDHVVLPVDDAYYESPQAWVTDNFTVTLGGYLEFFN